MGLPEIVQMRSVKCEINHCWFLFWSINWQEGWPRKISSKLSFTKFEYSQLTADSENHHPQNVRYGTYSNKWSSTYTIISYCDHLLDCLRNSFKSWRESVFNISQIKDGKVSSFVQFSQNSDYCISSLKAYLPCISSEDPSKPIYVYIYSETKSPWLPLQTSWLLRNLHSLTLVSFECIPSNWYRRSF